MSLSVCVCAFHTYVENVAFDEAPRGLVSVADMADVFFDCDNDSVVIGLLGLGTFLPVVNHHISVWTSRSRILEDDMIGTSGFIVAVRIGE